MSADVQQSTYIPRFTIRAILLATTLCALLFVVVGAGFRGHMWGWGIAIGVASLAVTAFVHAACFGIAWCFGALTAKKSAASSPAIFPSREEASQ